MSKPTLLLNFIGRFGNRLFEFASARARAEREGLEIHCHKWEGQFLFQNCDNPVPDGTEQLVHTGFYDGYCQRQEDIDHYSRADCLRWFKLHSDVEAALQSGPHHEFAVAHRRAGTNKDRDYTNCGYVVPMRDSYNRAWIQFYRDNYGDDCRVPVLPFVSEENPLINRMFPDHVAFMPDFYRLMTSSMLLRANSTFSWWAATLNSRRGRVYSPVVTGLQGGAERDCEFVKGNHPRFCDLPGCSDLYLKEK